jgi:hypothetical protein
MALLHERVNGAVDRTIQIESAAARAHRRSRQGKIGAWQGERKDYDAWIIIAAIAALPCGRLFSRPGNRSR